MAKKKTSNGIAVGARVRVKDGVAVPEFPDVLCAGWTGDIADITGARTAEPRYVVEWDAETLRSMPPGYQEQCEQKNLLYSMACLGREDFDVLD